MSRDDNARAAAALGPVAMAYLRCPDCLSDVDPREVRPGVWIALVIHDDSCPTYLAMPS